MDVYSFFRSGWDASSGLLCLVEELPGGGQDIAVVSGLPPVTVTGTSIESGVWVESESCFQGNAPTNNASSLRIRETRE